MLTTTSGISRLRSHYTQETRELLGVLVNAISPAEATLALSVLRDKVPEKSLVTACNLREILGALPASPFAMRVDEETLVRSAGLTKDIAAYSKTLPDDIELAVTTAGNLVLDVIVKANGEKYYWSPIPVEHEFVNPKLLDLIFESDHLIDAVLDLAKCMGVVVNPKFYLSIEDFRLEHAASIISELDQLF